jgi:FtsP/CotA-like multicopper oxidase with cupredoxin domain
MSNQSTPRGFTRRHFLKLAGQGLGLVVLSKALPAAAKEFTRLQSGRKPRLAMPAAAPLAVPAPLTMRLAATDNMTDIFLPGRSDPLYIFGFVEVPVGDSIDDLDIFKGQVQMPSPIIGVDEGGELYLTLTNLGFVGRPDLDDSHTIHWHGFRNPVALFDGVPEVSIAVPVARNFPYFYHPEDPGTYMYHCHFEDSEHVQMGMDGIVYVKPSQNGTSIEYPSGSGKFYTKFAYNDATPPGPLAGSTGYDREWALLLNEIDNRPHDGLLAVQEFVWSDYKPNYWIINGRAYPDTILPNGTVTGDSGLMEHQPISSLVQIEEHERGLLRFANLGYEQHAMQLTGITMKVVGEDATLLRGPAPDYVDLSYETNTIYIGPGEARDVIFEAPGFDGSAGLSDAAGSYDRYYLKNRNYQRLNNNGSVDAATGLGGMVTEVRVYPDGTLGPQTTPNQTYPV